MPPTLVPGTDTARVQIVAPASWVLLVDDWRRLQDKIPSRSDAIRQLVGLGLDTERKGDEKARK